MNTQLDRLRNDAIELDNYISRVEKRGDTKLISKLSAKKSYLVSHIALVEQSMQQERCLITQ